MAEVIDPCRNHLLPIHKSCILHFLLSPQVVLRRASVPHRSRTPLDGKLLLFSADDRPDSFEAKVESRPHCLISPSPGTSVPMKECSILHLSMKF
jgi:hypothetical protein